MDVIRLYRTLINSDGKMLFAEFVRLGTHTRCSVFLASSPGGRRLLNSSQNKRVVESGYGKVALVEDYWDVFEGIPAAEVPWARWDMVTFKKGMLIYADWGGGDGPMGIALIHWKVEKEKVLLILDGGRTIRIEKTDLLLGPTVELGRGNMAVPTPMTTMDVVLTVIPLEDDDEDPEVWEGKVSYLDSHLKGAPFEHAIRCEGREPRMLSSVQLRKLVTEGVVVLSGGLKVTEYDPDSEGDQAYENTDDPWCVVHFKRGAYQEHWLLSDITGATFESADEYRKRNLAPTYGGSTGKHTTKCIRVSELEAAQRS